MRPQSRAEIKKDSRDTDVGYILHALPHSADDKRFAVIGIFPFKKFGVRIPVYG